MERAAFLLSKIISENPKHVDDESIELLLFLLKLDISTIKNQIFEALTIIAHNNPISMENLGAIVDLT